MGAGVSTTKTTAQVGSQGEKKWREGDGLRRFRKPVSVVKIHTDHRGEPLLRVAFPSTQFSSNAGIVSAMSALPAVINESVNAFVNQGVVLLNAGWDELYVATSLSESAQHQILAKGMDLDLLTDLFAAAITKLALLNRTDYSDVTVPDDASTLMKGTP